jgi:CRP-like cAMP-binding protein
MLGPLLCPSLRDVAHLDVPRPPTLTQSGNLLIDALPNGARNAVFDTLERVKLPVRSTIYEQGGSVRHVYLPIDCVASVVKVMDDGTHIEVLTVGREGLTGAQALLDGATASSLTTIQIPGDAYRVELDAFSLLCERYPAVRKFAERYLSAQLDVMAQSIACNRLHSVNERCARWLMTIYDRIDRPEITLTHEMLATMLGVRRAGVSISAATLQAQGFISYSRGRFTVIDPRGLAGASCECYRAISEAFSPRRLAG